MGIIFRSSIKKGFCFSVREFGFLLFLLMVSLLSCPGAFACGEGLEEDTGAFSFEVSGGFLMPVAVGYGQAGSGWALLDVRSQLENGFAVGLQGLWLPGDGFGIGLRAAFLEVGTRAGCRYRVIPVDLALVRKFGLDAGARLSFVVGGGAGLAVSVLEKSMTFGLAVFLETGLELAFGGGWGVELSTAVDGLMEMESSRQLVDIGFAAFWTPARLAVGYAFGADEAGR